jgi:predicted RNase H-like nuclease (RuvC/YqgF family)
MIKPDTELENKKLRALLDRYQRYIKRLELNLREEKRKTLRLEHELFDLKRRMKQTGE